MIIDTEPREVSLEDLKKKRDNAQKGVNEFTKELSEIESINKQDVDDALEIERKLAILKKFRKKEGKIAGLTEQEKRFADLDKTIKDLEKKGQTKIKI